MVIAAVSAHPIAYAVALVLHIVSALVGFGSLALSGVYGGWGRHLKSRQDLEDLRRYFGKKNWAARCVWVVPFAGAAAVWLRSGAGALGQIWVFAATGCWAIGIAVAVAVIWPAEAGLQPIVNQVVPPPPPAGTAAASASETASPWRREDLERLCRRLGRGGAVCDVIFTVALVLMIFRPA